MELTFIMLTGTVQLFGATVEKFLHCPGTKGHQDKLKILPQDGTSRDSLSKSGTGRRTGQGTRQSLLFCQNPGRDVVREDTGQSLFISMISCFRTSFPVLERPFMFLNVLSCFRTEKKALMILWSSATLQCALEAPDKQDETSSAAFALENCQILTAFPIDHIFFSKNFFLSIYTRSKVSNLQIAVQMC